MGSTVSSGVNSLAAVTLEDFIKAFFVKDISELWATRITKLLAMTFGLISIALVFVAEQLGSILQAASTIHGIVGGPMLGVFTLGMFFPCANTWGATTGLLSGFIIAMWFGVGAFANQPFNPEAARSYQNCTDLFYNVTNIDLKNMTYLPQAIGNKLSYLWLSGIGFAVVLVVGITISLITGRTKSAKGQDIDERLLSPLVLWLNKHMPGGRFKKIILHRRKRRGTSLATLRTTSVISDDFYPSKKMSISYISDSKIS